jgi:hypothetical protein
LSVEGFCGAAKTPTAEHDEESATQGSNEINTNSDHVMVLMGKAGRSLDG